MGRGLLGLVQQDPFVSSSNKVESPIDATETQAVLSWPGLKKGKDLCLVAH